MIEIRCGICSETDDPHAKIVIREAPPQQEEEFIEVLSPRILDMITHLRLMHGWEIPFEEDSDETIVWFQDREIDARNKTQILFRRGCQAGDQPATIYGGNIIIDPNR